MELNKIHNIDCLEFMKTLPDKCIDLVLTDPPYGINMDRGTISDGGKRGSSKGFTSKRLYKSGDWDSSIPSEEVFNQILRVGKNVVITGGNYFAHLLPPSRCWVFWHKKPNYPQADTFADGELIWTSFDRNTRYLNYPTIGIAGINQPEEGKKLHPTMKPIGVMKWLVNEFSKESDIIFDPFLGSGTTAVACKQLKRNYIGCEISKEYCKIAQDRLDKMTQQLF